MESILYMNMAVFANTVQVQESYMIHDQCMYGIYAIMVPKMHKSVLKLQKRYQHMRTSILNLVYLRAFVGTIIVILM